MLHISFPLFCRRAARAELLLPRQVSCKHETCTMKHVPCTYVLLEKSIKRKRAARAVGIAEVRIHAAASVATTAQSRGQHWLQMMHALQAGLSVYRSIGFKLFPYCT